MGERGGVIRGRQMGGAIFGYELPPGVAWRRIED